MNTHYLITNREIVSLPKKKKGYRKVNNKEYIREDGKEFAQESLRFGSYIFSSLKDEGEIEIIQENELKIEEDIDARPSSQMFDDLYQKMAKGKPRKNDILVFIHGYNTDLPKALKTLRRLHYLYVEKEESSIKSIVLFTWSSMANLLRYRNDAKDAKASGHAFGRAISKFGDFIQTLRRKELPFCNQKIHLMTHSHGGAVLEAMMEQLNDEQETQLSDYFGQVILLAADVSRDALSYPNPLYDLVDIAEHIHVFYHRKDTALVISEKTKNPFNRLGRKGPKSIPSWNTDEYTLHDVTNTKDDVGSFKGRLFNHWYYFSSNEVIDMIHAILKK